MVTIQMTGVVQADGTVTLTLPAEVPPGEHAMVVVVETKPTVKARRGRVARGLQRTDTANGKADNRPQLPLHAAVPLVPDMTFSREEIYGEWGR